MIDGLWTVQFHGSQGFGGGVVVLNEKGPRSIHAPCRENNDVRFEEERSRMTPALFLLW